MPTPLTPPALEVVLQGLHESEIRCGIQNEPPAGGITAWIDFGSQTEKATFYGTIVGDREVWPAAVRIAAWLHETAMRLFPDSPYAKSHRPKRTPLSTSEPARAGLARVTQPGPMQWRMVRLIARSVALDYETADAAIVYAIQRAG
jgi:hypothetical protein